MKERQIRHLKVIRDSRPETFHDEFGFIVGPDDTDDYVRNKII